MPTFSQIAVIGAGTMGAGIAALAALAGVDVVLIDAHEPALERARARIARETERGGKAAAAERVTLGPSLDAIAAAQLVIEAVPEDLDLKTRLFSDLEARVTPEAILATNTSALSVAKIAEGLAQRERVLGLHFFNPPAAMQLVEIVHTAQTSSAALACAGAFVRDLGRTPIVVADTPGFVVNRVARPFYLQALRVLEAGVASAPALDALARGVGFAMGPFALMDLIGLDVNLATSQVVFEGTGAARLEPVATQLQMVVAGLLGRKTGEGFYRYNDKASAPHSEPLFAYRGLPLQSPLTLLDPDRVLAPLAAAAGAKGIQSRSVDDIESARAARTPVVFDAYRFSIEECSRAGIERAGGLGIVGSLDDQKIVEVVAGEDPAGASHCGGALLAAVGQSGIEVADAPGLFLGRTIASLVNEAAFALEEGVAQAADIDLALKLGVRYPYGPFEWGARIGYARVVAILDRVARDDSPAFGPAAWLRRASETAQTPAGSH